MSANPIQILKNDEVPLDELRGKRVSIIGYGNQGKAHAQNLRDNGIDIIIGARNPEKAMQDGFTVGSIAEASSADLVIIALPQLHSPESNSWGNSWFHPWVCGPFWAN